MTEFKLSYGSVILDSEDVEILETRSWFNDKLLSFIGEYLMNSANEVWKEETKSDEDLLHVFTPPETELIRHAGSAEEVEMFFGMLGVESKRLIAFIVNDNQDLQKAHGGSHWSLLVYDRKSDQFRHFDSSAGHNHQVAAKLMEKARRLVGQTDKTQKLQMEKVLQQPNGRDCGLFVAGYLWVLSNTAQVDAIPSIEKIDQSREFWTELIVNFPNKNSFEGKFKNFTH